MGELIQPWHLIVLGTLGSLVFLVISKITKRP